MSPAIASYISSDRALEAGQDGLEQLPPLAEWQSSQISAVEIEEIESEEDDLVWLMRGRPAPERSLQHAEVGAPLLVENDRLAVQDRRLHFESPRLGRNRLPLSTACCGKNVKVQAAKKVRYVVLRETTNFPVRAYPVLDWLRDAAEYFGKRNRNAEEAIQNALDDCEIVLLNALSVKERMMNHTHDTPGPQTHRRERHPSKDGRMVRQKNVAGRVFRSGQPSSTARSRLPSGYRRHQPEAVEALERAGDQFGGMEVSEAKRPKTLEDENTKLKRLLADAMLDNAALKDHKFAPGPIQSQALPR
ncbi:Mobile element protein (plasmid) [Sinorhizobium sojae CCBAU 05684]|uniref:Mobile element protein n=1 Tax=Sinorhizobium sojae CCBAU 05684 TaxID=716928 RepID=A0A249PL45_9HYPH|nr:Mobile element protein [Sinorhizobium sojae CCBAU 05684]